MTYFILFLMSVVFVELFLILNIMADAQSVLALSKKSVNVMQSKEMTDREKEHFMRTNSVTMLLTTFKFIGKFIAIIVILFAILWSVEQYNPPLALQIEESFYSISVIISLTAVTLLYIWIRNVIRRKL